MKILPVFREAFVYEDGVLSFNPKYKFIIKKGGRGRGASHSFCGGISVVGAQTKHTVFCVREIQRSIKDSVHKLLKIKIQDDNLENLYRITDRSITCKSGTDVIFSGLWGQEHTIRSTEGVTLTYVEEAQKVSKASWDSLLPTVLRTEGAQILIAYNPDAEDDPVEEIAKRDDALVIHSTVYDNPLAPQTLLDEAERCRVNDPDTHRHVWLGEHNKKTMEQVFGGKCVYEKVNHGDNVYYGLDFGFAADPTVLTTVSFSGGDILISAEFWYRLDIEEVKKKLGGRRYQNHINGDCADTGSIRYLKRRDIPIRGLSKLPIEDGIRWLHSFDRIVIDIDSKEMQEEAEKYKYKVDKRTGDILPVTIDDWNHGWDSVRYAVRKLIKRGI